MALKTCKECNLQVSSDAKACPHCGKKNPTNSGVNVKWLLIGVLVLSVYTAINMGRLASPPEPVRAAPTAAPLAPPPEPTKSRKDTVLSPAPLPINTPVAPEPRKEADDFQSTRMNVWPGKTLYLKADHTLIGEVINAESNHRFSDGTVREGVQIRFSRDSSVDWIPRETVHRLYVTK